LSNADVIMCCKYKIARLNWCSQLLPCFDGELSFTGENVRLFCGCNG